MTNNQHNWPSSRKLNHAIGITTWTSWTWTHEHEYEHGHESLNDMDKRLRETRTWNYLRKWYMVIICAWQGYGGMVVIGTWFTQGYSWSLIKFGCKRKWQDTGLIRGLIVEIEEVYLEYLCTRYGGVYFTWCISLSDMGYW